MLISNNLNSNKIKLKLRKGLRDKTVKIYQNIKLLKSKLFTLSDKAGFDEFMLEIFGNEDANIQEKPLTNFKSLTNLEYLYIEKKIHVCERI